MRSVVLNKIEDVKMMGDKFHRSRVTIHHLNQVLRKKNKMIRELNEKLRSVIKYDINRE